MFEGDSWVADGGAREQWPPKRQQRRSKRRVRHERGKVRTSGGLMLGSDASKFAASAARAVPPGLSPAGSSVSGRSGNGLEQKSARLSQQVGDEMLRAEAEAASVDSKWGWGSDEKAMMAQWLSSYKSEQYSFHSESLRAEAGIRSALVYAERLGMPNALTTAVAFRMLDNIGGLFGRFSPLLSTLTAVLRSATYVAPPGLGELESSEYFAESGMSVRDYFMQTPYFGKCDIQERELDEMSQLVTDMQAMVPQLQAPQDPAVRSKETTKSTAKSRWQRLKVAEMATRLGSAADMLHKRKAGGRSVVPESPAEKVVRLFRAMTPQDQMRCMIPICDSGTEELRVELLTRLLMTVPVDIVGSLIPSIVDGKLDCHGHDITAMVLALFTGNVAKAAVGARVEIAVSEFREMSQDERASFLESVMAVPGGMDAIDAMTKRTGLILAPLGGSLSRQMSPAASFTRSPAHSRGTSPTIGRLGSRSSLVGKLETSANDTKLETEITSEGPMAEMEQGETTVANLQAAENDDTELDAMHAAGPAAQDKSALVHRQLTSSLNALLCSDEAAVQASLASLSSEQMSLLCKLICTECQFCRDGLHMRESPTDRSSVRLGSVGSMRSTSRGSLRTSSRGSMRAHSPGTRLPSPSAVHQRGARRATTASEKPPSSGGARSGKRQRKRQGQLQPSSVDAGDAEVGQLSNGGGAGSGTTKKGGGVNASPWASYMRKSGRAAKKSAKVPMVLALVYDCYEKKIIADEVEDRIAASVGPLAHRRQALPLFIKDYLLQRYGLPSLSDAHLRSVVACLQKNHRKNRRLRLFGMLCGVVDPSRYCERLCDIVLNMLKLLFPKFNSTILRSRKEGHCWVTLHDAVSACEHCFPVEPLALSIDRLALSGERRASFLATVKALGVEYGSLDARGAGSTQTAPPGSDGLPGTHRTRERKKVSRSDSKGGMAPAVRTEFDPWEHVVSLDDVLDKAVEVWWDQTDEDMETLKRMFAEYDADGNGLLTFREFQHLLTTCCPSNLSHRESMQLFRHVQAIDTSEGDAITPDSFAQLALEFGLTPDHERLAARSASAGERMAHEESVTELHIDAPSDTEDAGLASLDLEPVEEENLSSDVDEDQMLPDDEGDGLMAELGPPPTVSNSSS